MKNPHMLYRCPGPEVFEGVQCETVIVEAEEVEAMHAQGWRRDWMQAKAAMQEAADSVPETPAEPTLKAVHKGRGVWALVDASGAEVETGLTKDEAQAKAGG
ncbi:MAG TPA: hypothetical protein VFM98_01800 [Ramlibacter sp.]|uniref:hypothetical protein n=1 Tax=Ramlibacter sp. TaxID=1917967 RepID=UPI002D807FD5|nr:hypothetical protein [Ramlibacter sp.]HET8744309.1 hypothetical protein [Ramlibacter sp.]